ncbi:MAG: hypothetical protein KGK34_07225 [Chloroflexota bacterium]|nr:hypothetical protein [Chloroflexota bacterium]
MSVRSSIISNVSGAPTAIASPVDPGPANELAGRFEVQVAQNNSGGVAATPDVELFDRPDGKWGQGIHLAGVPAGAKLGGSYYEDNNPDPHEWFAMSDPAGAAGQTVRVQDSRRAKELRAAETVINVGKA